MPIPSGYTQKTNYGPSSTEKPPSRLPEATKGAPRLPEYPSARIPAMGPGLDVDDECNDSQAEEPVGSGEAGRP